VKLAEYITTNVTKVAPSWPYLGPLTANMPFTPNASSLSNDGRADHDSPASGSPTTALPRTDYDLSVHTR
jgi:hypothetical protein